MSRSRRRLPGIFRGQEAVEEEALLVGPDGGTEEVGLDGVGVEEVLGSLDDADGRVVKQAQHAAQQGAVGDEVGVEQEQEVGGAAGGALGRERVLHGVVDVAGLGVLALDAEM